MPRTIMRVRYQFMPYFINGVRHRWEVTWCPELNKWITSLYYYVNGHSKFKTSNISVKDIFKTNVIGEIKVTTSVEKSYKLVTLYEKQYGEWFV